MAATLPSTSHSSGEPEIEPVPEATLSGKLVISVLALLVVAGVGGGWWYHTARQARPLAFWGSPHAQRIMLAPQVEVLRISPTISNLTTDPPLAEQLTTDEVEVLRISPLADDPPGEPDLRLGERGFSFKQRQTLVGGGLPTLRNSLLVDASFDWSGSVPAEPAWDFLLSFRDAGGETQVLFSSQDQAIGLAGGRTVSLAPSADAVRGFLEDMLKPRSGSGE